MHEAQSGLECPLCGSTAHRDIGVNPDFSPSRILACRSCGFMRTSPMPADSELAERYRQEYRELRRERITDLFLAARGLRAQAQHSFILGTAPEWRNSAELDVMDVGCAAGSLLEVFASNARILIGYEPDERMASAARDRLAGRAEIRNRLLDWPPPDERRYDLICMSHSLEHTREPISTLSHLFEYCNEGGRVFLEVPNETLATVRTLCDRDTRGVFHLHFFQADHLRRCIELAGGRVLRIGTFGDDLHAPPFLGSGGMRRIATGVSSRFFRSARARQARLSRAMFYENPRGGIWLRCLCARWN